MKLDVWGFPVFKYSFENQDKVLEEVLKTTELIKPVDTSDEWNATSMMSTPEERNMCIEGEINKCIEKFSKDLSIPGEMLTLNECGNPNCNHPKSKAYWINAYKKGQHQDTHWHMTLEDDYRLSNSDVMFSFTYFAKYDPEKDAKFIFVNPSPAPKLFRDWVEMVPEFRPAFIPEVQQGDIIIFPCFMLHCVDTHTSEDTRLTVSGNIHNKIGTVCKCDTRFGEIFTGPSMKKKYT
tara:strand:- start:3214 stop:3921 length:708 start_codon:yes stop_codon:yes gene_type:complete